MRSMKRRRSPSARSLVFCGGVASAFRRKFIGRPSLPAEAGSHEFYRRLEQQPALPRSGQAARRTCGRPAPPADAGGEDVTPRHDRAGDRTPEGAGDERLEPEPARHRVDRADDDVPGADQHGGDVEPRAGARCRGRHRRRGTGDQQLLADGPGEDRADGRTGTERHGHGGRQAPAAQRARLSLAGHQHQPRSAMGPHLGGLRRRHLADLADDCGVREGHAG